MTTSRGNPVRVPGRRCVWVFVLGAWHPAVVIDNGDAGRVLARYQRIDGELAERAFHRSSVVASDAL